VDASGRCWRHRTWGTVLNLTIETAHISQLTEEQCYQLVEFVREKQTNMISEQTTYLTEVCTLCQHFRRKCRIGKNICADRICNRFKLRRKSAKKHEKKKWDD
jgi:hypothetical protein